jgi:hypothetical protein
MALMARVSEESWDWSDDGEEEAPVTSRSPSFVRLATSVAASERDPAEFVTIAEPVLPHADDALLARWSDLDVMARMRLLRIEETMLRVHDTRLEKLARAVLDDANAVTDALRVLHVMWTCAPDAAPSAPLASTFPVVQHVFEWLAGVLVRADDHVAAVLDGQSPYDGDLAAVEYSSLFVRTILEPMLAEAIDAHEAAHDREATVQLREVRERALWLNWTVRALGSPELAE